MRLISSGKQSGIVCLYLQESTTTQRDLVEKKIRLQFGAVAQEI